MFVHLNQVRPYGVKRTGTRPKHVCLGFYMLSAAVFVAKILTLRVASLFQASTFTRYIKNVVDHIISCSAWIVKSHDAFTQCKLLQK